MSETQMAGEEAGGASRPRGLLGAAAPWCRCRRPQMCAGNYSSCRAGRRALPRLGSPAGAPLPRAALPALGPATPLLAKPGS